MAPYARTPHSWHMANEMGASHGRSQDDRATLDADAESAHPDGLHVLQRASRLGEELSRHLAEVPAFMFDKESPSRVKRLLEHWAKRVTIRSIVRLVVHRKRVKATLQEIPIRMQRVTNQVRLVLELIDDFAEGTYRDIPWHSMAIAAGAILYSVSPADLVPDALPLVGNLDDLIVLGIALRLIEKDLRRYAASKGHEPSEYFGDADSPTSGQTTSPT
jgi:uncharacterized membrane protein YkvA (DUF1232 family)